MYRLPGCNPPTSFPLLWRGQNILVAVTLTVAIARGFEVRRVPQFATARETLRLVEGPLGSALVRNHNSRTSFAAASDSQSGIIRASASAVGSTASVYLREPAHRADPLLRRFALRAAGVIGVPITRLEPAVLTRYREGQRYGFHHDSR